MYQSGKAYLNALDVARVAIRNPTVLVMDEATAFMDPSTEATLQRDLDRLLNRRTAVVIAHRLATVEAADRILVLRRGSLIEQGTHLQLRASGGLYAELADLRHISKWGRHRYWNVFLRHQRCGFRSRRQ